MDEKIRRRYVTFEGERVNYTYNVRNREVCIPGIEPFQATSWDIAPDEVKEALSRQ